MKDLILEYIDSEGILYEDQLIDATENMTSHELQELNDTLIELGFDIDLPNYQTGF